MKIYFYDVAGTCSTRAMPKLSQITPSSIVYASPGSRSALGSVLVWTHNAELCAGLVTYDDVKFATMARVDWGILVAAVLSLWCTDPGATVYLYFTNQFNRLGDYTPFETTNHAIERLIFAIVPQYKVSVI